MNTIDFIQIILMGLFILVILLNVYLYRKYHSMKKEKEKFESILEDSDSIIFTKNLSGNYTFVNKQFEKIHGESRDIIIGKKDSDLYPKAFAELYVKDDQLVFEKNNPIQFNEADHQRPDLHYITNKYPLYHNGELSGLAGIATNVSDKIYFERESFAKQLAEKRFVEEELKNSLRKKEIQLKAIIEHNPDWIVILDRDGTWIDYYDTKLNPMTEEIKKANPNGKNIKEFLEPDFYTSLSGFIKECLEKQSIIKNESSNENNQFFEEYYVPLSKNEMMAIIRNITDRKSVEIDLKKRSNELEQANSQLIEFSYVLSHDLKAPLIVMGSLLELMITDQNGDKFNSETNFSKINSLKVKIDSMIQLINGLLKFFEITQSNDNMPYEIVDCNALVDEIIETLQPPENIEIEIMPNLPKLHYHKVRLYQLFQNLLSNSIKYNNKSKGIIKISAKKSPVDSSYTFSFYDNGIGIELDDYNKIFNVFSKGRKARTNMDFSSSGIGLSIVKKIIDTMGGEIKVESIVDVETQFIINIPDYYVIAE